MDWIAESNACQYADNKINVLKFPLPPPPDENLKSVVFPEDLGSLSDSELALQRTAWTNLCSFAEFYVARADAEQTAAEVRMRQLKNKFLMEIIPKTGSSKRDLAEAEQNPLFIEAEKTYLKKRAFYKHLCSLLSGYERKYNAASRELSRRISERER